MLHLKPDLQAESIVPPAQTFIVCLLRLRELNERRFSSFFFFFIFVEKFLASILEYSCFRRSKNFENPTGFFFLGKGTIFISSSEMGNLYKIFFLFFRFVFHFERRKRKLCEVGPLTLTDYLLLRVKSLFSLP